MEFALGAHYRVCESKAKLGLPEVNLGLLPGAGGTQRLPRICGLQAALQMIVGGIPVSASTAKKSGLVDEIYPSDGKLLENAITFLLSKVNIKYFHIWSKEKSKNVVGLHLVTLIIWK